MPAHPARRRLTSGFCSSARRFVPRFLRTFPRGHALAVPLSPCDQVLGGLSPPSQRPCWAYITRPRLVAEPGSGTFGVGGAGLPPAGAPGPPQQPEVPYEDATSTEQLREQSNGTPPFRGSAATEGPNPPDSVSRPSPRNRVRYERTNEPDWSLDACLRRVKAILPPCPGRCTRGSFRHAKRPSGRGLACHNTLGRVDARRGANLPPRRQRARPRRCASIPCVSGSRAATESPLAT